MDVLQDRVLDAALSAIANPARRRIVERTAGRPATVGELAELLGIGVPATLKHVGLLVDAGLVTRTKTGRTVVVRSVPGSLAPLADWAMRTRLFWTHHLDRLAAHLADEHPTDREDTP